VGDGVALWVLGAVCIAGSVGPGDFDAWAKGRRVLDATLPVTYGDPPSFEAVRKLLDTAFARRD
jgi:hypothetical protein